MPRRKSESLTEAEQRMMEVLWEQGSGTVSEVLARIDDTKRPAFNTVQTLLRILEQKGYVRHGEEGRAFRYFPVVDRAHASRSAVHSVVRRFFGSPGALAMNLLQNERLSIDELARLRRLIDEAEGERE
jgi:predicted transcriptional regulator